MQLSPVRASRKRGGHAPYREWYLAADASCVVTTNSDDVLISARHCFRRSTSPRTVPDVRMFLWVDPNARGSPPWPQPFFRGLNHLVYAGLDAECSLLLDLRRHQVIGRFSPAMARDAGYCQRVIFPNAIGLMSEALGLTTLHCACVERDGAGLLLSGGSGAGKSTLALALARNGFSFLSDDWTYFSGAGNDLRAWGLDSSIKLLPDAVRHFPDLAGLTPAISPNGELAYEIDPERVFGAKRSFTCEPRKLIFLEPCDSAGHRFARLDSRATAARLEVDLEDLPAELATVREAQSKTILELAGRESWLLRHGQNPQEIAQAVAGFCANLSPSPTRAAQGSRGPSKAVRTGPDIIKRFTPTPLVADLRAIQLETNSAALLQKVRHAICGPSSSSACGPRFRWRLVSDTAEDPDAPWQVRSGLSAHGLRLENFGQCNFFAVDAEAHMAVGFVTEELMNGSGFKFFVDRLVSETSAALETTRLKP